MDALAQHYSLVIELFKGLALLLGPLALFGALPEKFWVRTLIAVTLSVLLSHLLVMSQDSAFGFDLRMFWCAGCDVWAGVDPYASPKFDGHPFLNPPTALPLFAVFAAIPLPASLLIWTMANVIAILALVPLTWCAVGAKRVVDDRSSSEVGRGGAPGLTQAAGLALSPRSRGSYLAS
jgi:hypothetical protein